MSYYAVYMDYTHNFRGGAEEHDSKGFKSYLPSWKLIAANRFYYFLNQITQFRSYRREQIEDIELNKCVRNLLENTRPAEGRLAGQTSRGGYTTTDRLRNLQISPNL